MFSIYDGRICFYQWDIDRKLIVNDETITEVHFCNRTDDCSLVCKTYTDDDGKTLVNVPNILLQNDWRINVYAYDGQATKHNAVFNVIGRSKPADYTYTETEIVNWDAFEARVNSEIEEIEESVKASYATSSEAKVSAIMAENKAIEALEDAADALAIAKGANQAMAFKDYTSCFQWLINNRTEPGEDFPIGKIIIIKKLNVPDLYIYGRADSFSDYLLTEAQALSDLEMGGYTQAGYCLLAQLETQKVNIEDYITKEQVPVITATLKSNGAYTLTITKGVD